MKSFDDRFADAVRDLLGDQFTVTNSQGLIVAKHVHGATFQVWPQWLDRRSAIVPEDAQKAAQQGVSRLRNDMRHYTDKAKRQANLLLCDVGHIYP